MSTRIVIGQPDDPEGRADRIVYVLGRRLKRSGVKLTQKQADRLIAVVQSCVR